MILFYGTPPCDKQPFEIYIDLFIQLSYETAHIMPHSFRKKPDHASPLCAAAPHGLGLLVELPGLPVALEVDDEVLTIPDLGQPGARGITSPKHHG